MESRGQKYNPETTNHLKHLLTIQSSIHLDFASIKSLLDRGADPNIMSNHTLANDKTTIIHLLLAHAININSESTKSFQHIKQVVNEYKADINIRNGSDATPLQFFMNSKKNLWHTAYTRDEALSLVKLGADTTVADTDGYTLGERFLEANAFASYDELKKILEKRKVEAKISVGPKVFDKSATKAAHEIRTNKQTHHAAPRAKRPGQTG